MPSSPMPPPKPSADDEPLMLERLLDALPAPLEPLDVSMLDGYLCGVLLQPRPVPEPAWWPLVLDAEGRAAPTGVDADALRAGVRQRHRSLDQAIGGRQWFDPWVFELDDEARPLEAVLGWVAGFALAMDRFPALMQLDSADVVEPLAVLYAAFDPDDLEDAQALLDVIDTLEPPQDLTEAVEGLVSSVLLLADVTRPLPVASRAAGGARAPVRRPVPRRAGPAGRR